MVKWSDGTYSLVVGDEIFDADIKPFQEDERVFLYAFHQEHVMFEGKGRLQEKMTFQPSSTASATHKKLTREILSKSSKETKVKYTISEKDPEKIRAEIEKVCFGYIKYLDFYIGMYRRNRLGKERLEKDRPRVDVK